MFKYLFLDDIRDPHAEFMNYMYGRGVDASIYPNNYWDIVRDYDAFVNWITNNGVPDVVSLDHDLADEHYDSESVGMYLEKTGFDCVKFLVDYCHDNDVLFPEYYIHSANPSGSKNMESYIENAIKHKYITKREI